MVFECAVWLRVGCWSPSSVNASGDKCLPTRVRASSSLGEPQARPWCCATSNPKGNRARGSLLTPVDGAELPLADRKYRSGVEGFDAAPLLGAVSFTFPAPISGTGLTRISSPTRTRSVLRFGSELVAARALYPEFQNQCWAFQTLSTAASNCATLNAVLYPPIAMYGFATRLDNARNS
jgi:hypothetical protein